VTVDPPDLIVAVLPLNCAIRKRRTSFWSVVSNVNMKRSFAHATIVPTRSALQFLRRS
jgi:hypothetical protein